MKLREIILIGVSLVCGCVSSEKGTEWSQQQLVGDSSVSNAYNTVDEVINEWYQEFQQYKR